MTGLLSSTCSTSRGRSGHRPLHELRTPTQNKPAAGHAGRRASVWPEPEARRGSVPALCGESVYASRQQTSDQTSGGERLVGSMTIAQTDEPTPRKPLRLWPGVVAVVLQWLVRFLVPVVVPEAGIFAVLGGLVGGLAVVVWWVFFSRAAWIERLGAIGLMIVALFATSRVVHESIATGMMGMMLVIYAVPVLSLAFVAWAVASRRLSDGLRRASMVATILLACGVFTLLRTGGITGEGASQFAWRWTKTPEERLLSQANDKPLALPSSTPAAAKTPQERLRPQAGDEPAALPSAPAAVKKGADWPGFRGPDRDGIVRGVRIETDWARSPPVQLWRRPIGPGWSSFAVSGDLLYTQEQRGDDEVVACYRMTTGEPVWRHSDAVRFWESNGGAGPRATPTLSNDRVYTFGATGILNALDAGNGAVAWSRNVASDSNTKVPGWGFASSPLVAGDVVIVAASGKMVAYDIETGMPRWFGPDHRGSYSAPHCRRAPTCRMDRRRALDLSGTEALLQRPGRSPGPCLRVRRQHSRVH